MIIYLETNFLLELALRREQSGSCRQLLDWCADQKHSLYLPVYALAEARSAFRRRERTRFGLVDDLKAQARDLARLRGSSDLAHSCEDTGSALGASIDHERASLNTLVEELLLSASFIALDHAVVERAEDLRRQSLIAGDGDLLVFASVVRNLEDRQRAGTMAESIFITRDADFGGDAAKWLRPFSCELLNSYDAAVARLKESLE